MKPVFRFAFALAVVGAIGACSSDSTGPSYDGTVDAEGAGMAAETALSAVHEMMGGIAGGGLAATEVAARMRGAVQKALAPASMPADRIPRGWRPIDLSRGPQLALGAHGVALSTPPGCSTSESGMDGSGDPIDANGNGIPDDYRQTLRCEFTEEVSEDSTATQKIEIDILFKERTDDLFGYDLKVRQAVSVTTNFGVYQKQSQEQQQGMSLRADRASTNELVSLEMRIKYDSDSAEQHAAVYNSAAMRFTPESPIALGSPVPDGEVVLNGEFRYIDSTEPIAIRFVIDTPEPLQYSASCDLNEGQAFVGGILRGRFNGRGSVGFTAEFLSCGDGLDYETFGIDEGAPVAPRFHP